MYKNAGKRLFEALSDATGIAICGWVLLGLAIWGYVALFTEISGGLGLFVGAIIAVIGGMKSWYKNLERAAVAEMAMNVYRIAEKNCLVTEEKCRTAEGWKCAFCDQVNSAESDCCQGCGVEKNRSEEMMNRKIKAQLKWKCAKCGQENAVGTCQSCGVTREWSEKHSQERTPEREIHYCPKCGTAYKENASFCTACGTKVSN